jgi:hypothetical protein
MSGNVDILHCAVSKSAYTQTVASVWQHFKTTYSFLITCYHQTHRLSIWYFLSHGTLVGGAFFNVTAPIMRQSVCVSGLLLSGEIVIAEIELYQYFVNIGGLKYAAVAKCHFILGLLWLFVVTDKNLFHDWHTILLLKSNICTCDMHFSPCGCAEILMWW